MAENNDTLVILLTNKVNAKKEQLKAINNPKFITNCVLNLNGTSHNIKALSGEALVFLLLMVNELLMSAKDLGMTGVKLSGFTLEEWVSDLKTRQQVLSKQEEERKLKDLEAELQNLLSQEKKNELRLSQIKDLLGE
jgi:hypothetical protein